MTKITKEDIKNNGIYNKLIPMYTLIIAFVYGYWFYSKEIKLWIIILSVIGIISVGIIIYFYSIIRIAKNRIKNSNESES